MSSLWKEKFWELSYDICTTDSIKEARKLKHDNFPSSLYRYRSLSKFSLYELKFNTVWQSCPNDFNDPFDSSFNLNTFEHCSNNLLKSKQVFIHNYGKVLLDLNIDIDLYYEKVMSEENPLEFLYNDLSKIVYPDKQLNLYESIKNTSQEIDFEHLKSYKDKWTVSCFSELNDSILMWSHYANNHQGFCIEYDFKNDFTTLYMDLIKPVIYDDKLFQFDYSRHPFSILGALTKKSKCWKYENEWRLVLELDVLKGNRNYTVPCPVAIYLGCKMPASDRELLLDIARSKKIKVYQMEMSTSEFKLIAKEIRL